MSLKSIFQDMRSRSRRVVQDGSAPERRDGLDQSCWANMPQELLREVLVRIEASETAWPPRKSVVACAGVCRSWRAITKEIVRTPEISGRLTFPISVKQVSITRLLNWGFLSLCTIWWIRFIWYSTNWNWKSFVFLIFAKFAEFVDTRSCLLWSRLFRIKILVEMIRSFNHGIDII